MCPGDQSFKLKEAREHHLVDLFRIFGFVTHVYIPVDENGSSRGVGYVKFAHRRETESAVGRVNVGLCL